MSDRPSLTGAPVVEIPYRLSAEFVTCPVCGQPATGYGRSIGEADVLLPCECVVEINFTDKLDHAAWSLETEIWARDAIVRILGLRAAPEIERFSVGWVFDERWYWDRERGGWYHIDFGGAADRFTGSLSEIPDEAWVCEEHPDLPFPHDDCAGPGMLNAEWQARIEGG